MTRPHGDHASATASATTPVPIDDGLLPAGERIRQEVLSWPGVTAAPHRFGGLEYRLGKREIGHVHGDVLADLPFPVRVREQLVREGRAQPHHILPRSGCVSYYIRAASDVAGALDLFRLSYEFAVAARGLPESDRDGSARENVPEA